VAIVRGIAAYIVGLLRARGGAGPEEVIRLALGRALSLALEFQVAADILGTALDPTQQDLIILAAVVALRTLLNYFLGRELDAARPPRSGCRGAAGRARHHRHRRDGAPAVIEVRAGTCERAAPSPTTARRQRGTWTRSPSRSATHSTLSGARSIRRGTCLLSWYSPGATSGRPRSSCTRCAKA